jgi:hypothetical protein
MVLVFKEPQVNVKEIIGKAIDGKAIMLIRGQATLDGGFIVSSEENLLLSISTN